MLNRTGRLVHEFLIIKKKYIVGKTSGISVGFNTQLDPQFLRQTDPSNISKLLFQYTITNKSY